jgi:hypothetical protein
MFGKELIAFASTKILVSDTASRKETIICISTKSIKQHNLGGCSFAIADGTDLGGTPL